MSILSEELSIKDKNDVLYEIFDYIVDENGTVFDCDGYPVFDGLRTFYSVIQHARDLAYEKGCQDTKQEIRKSLGL